MAMNLNFSSAPVQTHAVRTAPVRGSAGDMSSYKFSGYTYGDISEHYIHVPEIDMTAVVSGTSDLNYIRRIGSFRAVCEAAGAVSDFYLISPSFISDTVTEGLVTQGGAIYGGHSEVFSDDAYGSITNHVIYKVAACIGTAESDMSVPKTAITYNGYPVLRPDSGCCVYGGFDASLRFGDDRNLWPDWVDNGASGGDGSGNITVPGTDGGFKPGGGTGGSGGSGGSGSGGDGSGGGSGSEYPVTPPTQAPGTGIDASGNPVAIATPTVVYPVWDQEFRALDIEVESSAFSVTTGTTVQDGVEWQIEYEDGTVFYNTTWKNTSKFNRQSIRLPMLSTRTALYVKCRHDAQHSSWTAWSERTRIIVLSSLDGKWIDLPSGRQMKRHESNLGTVFRYYDNVGVRNVLIFDLAYCISVKVSDIAQTSSPAMPVHTATNYLTSSTTPTDALMNAAWGTSQRDFPLNWANFSEYPIVYAKINPDLYPYSVSSIDVSTSARMRYDFWDLISLDLSPESFTWPSTLYVVFRSVGSINYLQYSLSRTKGMYSPTTYSSLASSASINQLLVSYLPDDYN